MRIRKRQNLMDFFSANYDYVINIIRVVRRIKLTLLKLLNVHGNIIYSEI